MNVAGGRFRAALVGLAASAALAVAATPAHAQTDCRNAAMAASVAPLSHSGAAIGCLVNRIRAARDLPLLRHSERLHVAATRHGIDMVQRRFFAHVTPEGRTLTDRVERSGYLRRADGYTIGENLAWGTGELSTPEAIVAAWMRSAPHRAVILDRRVREAGIGVVRGVPVNVEGEGATYVLAVGVTD